jgi:hypothetical protein
MLPVSAVAIKYSIWRSVYRMCGVSNSGEGDPESWI